MTPCRVLAVVWAVLLPRTDLEVCQSSVRTDDDPLNRIVNLSDSTGKLARWRLGLFELELDVVQGTGIKHQATYAFLQLRAPGEDEKQIKDFIPVLCITPSRPTKKKR